MYILIGIGIMFLLLFLAWIIKLLTGTWIIITMGVFFLIILMGFVVGLLIEELDDEGKIEDFIELFERKRNND